MGFGGDGSECQDMPDMPDMLEASIIAEPQGDAQRFRNRVFGHVLKHRDALGYPKGCREFPYMLCSNDLCEIAVSFMSMIKEKKGLECSKEMVKDVPNILDLLIKSYDDVACKECGCCGPWHSVAKEKFVAIHQLYLKSAEGKM